jgi:hypothetical protein
MSVIKVNKMMTCMFEIHLAARIPSYLTLYLSLNDAKTPHETKLATEARGYKLRDLIQSILKDSH